LISDELREQGSSAVDPESAIQPAPIRLAKIIPDAIVPNGVNKKNQGQSAIDLSATLARIRRESHRRNSLIGS